jgi:hypothetical protein
MGYKAKSLVVILFSGLMIILLWCANFGLAVNWMLFSNLAPLAALAGLAYLGCRKYPAMTFYFTLAALVITLLLFYSPLLAKPWGNGPDPGLIFLFAPISQLIILAVFIFTWIVVVISRMLWKRRAKIVEGNTYGL